MFESPKRLTVQWRSHFGFVMYLSNVIYIHFLSTTFDYSSFKKHFVLKHFVIPMYIQWAPIVTSLLHACMNPIAFYLFFILVFHRMTHPPVISHKCYHTYSLLQYAKTCKYLSLMLDYPNTSFFHVALLMFFSLFFFMYSPIIKWDSTVLDRFLHLFLCRQMFLLINIKYISLVPLLFFTSAHTSTYV